MKKNITILLLAALFLSSCADSWLDRQYQGGNISQEQYDKLSSEKMEGTLLGLYAMIYTMGGDQHDEFGQRSIDLWGDLLSGDIALTNKTYGWLYTDEQMLTVSARTGTIWSFYYNMLHNINTIVFSIENSSKIMNLIAENGYPGDGGAYTYTEEETMYALYMAQALAMRGYCYGNLARWYTPVMKSSYMTGYTIDTYKCVPLYTESNMDSPQALSTSAEVYNRVFSDLSTSIMLFEKFGAYYEEVQGSKYNRDTKLIININVARGLIAYSYLNAAPYYKNVDNEKMKNYYRLAHKYANDVILSGEFSILKNDELCTTGFNNVNHSSWMWGQNVVVETAGGLKSWFGQMDIHSYSYAWAGDTKVLDDGLKTDIEARAWDGRINWFNDGKKKSTFKDCPDGKFFSAQSPTSTAEEDIDREWLSDNIFMRYESMFLIASEACYFIDSLAASADYLTQITDERMNLNYPFAQDDYTAYKASLSNGATLLKEIEYNWRVEMWGEGYGLQTFRRLTGTKKRGGNHDYAGGSEVNASDHSFNMNIPGSEATYNPNI